MEQDRNVLIVREEYDEEGELVWTVVAKTYDRRAIDTLAEALRVRLDIITSTTR
jgi:hypothetical protein